MHMIHENADPKHHGNTMVAYSRTQKAPSTFRRIYFVNHCSSLKSYMYDSCWDSKKHLGNYTPTKHHRLNSNPKGTNTDWTWLDSSSALPSFPPFFFWAAPEKVEFRAEVSRVCPWRNGTLPPNELREASVRCPPQKRGALRNKDRISQDLRRFFGQKNTCCIFSLIFRGTFQFKVQPLPRWNQFINILGSNWLTGRCWFVKFCCVFVNLWWNFVVVSFFELQKHHLNFKHKTPPLFHHKVIRRYTLVESFITPKTNQPQPAGPLWPPGPWLKHAIWTR